MCMSFSMYAFMHIKHVYVVGLSRELILWYEVEKNVDACIFSVP